jgi:hypothetical protein
MKYNALTRRYFDSAACAGVLAGPDIFRGSAGSQAQGTWVQFDVQVDTTRAPGAIRAVRFLAFGCPHVIAVAAWLSEQAAGRDLVARLPENLPSLRERFGVPIEKLGRLLTVEDAWISAVGAAGGIVLPPTHPIWE